MIFAEFLWRNVLLREKLQINAKNSNYEILRMPFYMKSVNMPLTINYYFVNEKGQKEYLCVIFLGVGYLLGKEKRFRAYPHAQICYFCYITLYMPSLIFQGKIVKKKRGERWAKTQ